jgi:FkbM family methyltransferase
VNQVNLSIEDLSQLQTIFVHEGQDLVSMELAENGVWESYETKLLMSCLGPGKAFLDVGANIGYYSMVADALVGKTGSVYAFEPELHNFNLLQHNMSSCTCEDIILYHAGLADTTRAGQLFLSADNRGDHRLSHDPEREVQSVELIRGDDLVEGKKIDFLKIDTQGAECQVLHGLQNTLSKNLDWIEMIVEFWPWGLQEAGQSAVELVDLLRPLGLQMYIIDHLNEHLIPVVENDLLEFAEQTQSAPDPQGFINLFLTANKMENHFLADSLK